MGYGMYRPSQLSYSPRSPLSPLCISPELLSPESMGVKLKPIKTRIPAEDFSRSFLLRGRRYRHTYFVRTDVNKAKRVGLPIPTYSSSEEESRIGNRTRVTFRRVIGRSTWAPVGRVCVSYATSKTPLLLSSAHGGGEAKPKHLSLLGVGGLSIYNWEPKLDDPLSSSHGGGEGKKDGAGGGGELDGRRGPPHRERARRRGRRWRRLEDGRRTARARQDPVPGAILAPCVSVGGVPKTAVLERVKILFQVPFSLLVRLLEASLRRPYWSATRSCSRCDSRALCVRFVDIRVI
ncbi:hypothetical protein BHE74_00029564 [Ensete ventricosum]|nr:hypothetical protein BHE74_00029564 [Ensete ventricosum]